MVSSFAKRLSRLTKAFDQTTGELSRRAPSWTKSSKRLVGNALFVEIPRKAVAREDAVGGERRAAVRVAVADVDDRPAVRQAAALARLAALRRTARRRARSHASRRAARRAGSRAPRARRPRARAPGRSARGTRSRGSAADACAANSRKPGRTVTCSRTQRTASRSGSVSVPISTAITSCSENDRPSTPSVRR